MDSNTTTPHNSNTPKPPDHNTLAAELAEIKGKLQDTTTELEQSRQTVTRLERRQKIDALLADSDTVDMDLARLLTEAAVEMMDEPDLRMAIDDLRRTKPYLFRRHHTERAMPARSHGAAPAEQAARKATESGHRRDLLSYLRLRCPAR